MIVKLEQKLNDCKDVLERISPTDFDTDIKPIDFSGGVGLDYENSNAAAYYLLKYGAFYAKEYAVIYDLALRVLALSVRPAPDRDGRLPSIVYSFGCGSKLDAVSLEYVRDNLRTAGTNFRLFYKGVDLVRWADPGLFDTGALGGNIMVTNSQGVPVAKPDFSEIDPLRFLGISIDDFFNQMSSFNANIFFFPKILSEIPPAIIDVFCRDLKVADIRSDYLIIAVSYRGSITYTTDSANTQKIIDTLIRRGYVIENYDPYAMGWIGSTKFELSDIPRKVFISKYNADTAPEPWESDFDLATDLNEFMGWGTPGHGGTINEKCGDFSTALGAYVGAGGG